MRINRLETHDRLIQFNKQADMINKGCADCIKGRPPEFESYPFYIFAHKRELGLDERITMYNQDLRDSIVNPMYIRRYTDVNQVPTARLIWSPRLTKPSAQTNSMLFKYYPENDVIHIKWILPDEVLWEQYDNGKMTASQPVIESIHNYRHNLQQLQSPDADDITEDRASAIYSEISRNRNSKNYVMI